MGNTKVSKNCYLKDEYKRSLLLQFPLVSIEGLNNYSCLPHCFTFFLKFPVEAVDCFFCASLNFSNYINVFVYDLLEMVANTFIVEVCRHGDKQHILQGDLLDYCAFYCALTHL